MNSLAQRLGGTLHTLLLSGVAVTRWHAQQKACFPVSTLSSGRERYGLERGIGFFLRFPILIMEGIEERTTFAEIFAETARQMTLFWSNQEASVLEAFFDAGMSGLFLGYRLNFYVEARKPLSLADIGVTVIREYLWPATTDYEWSLYAGLADGLELTLVCREDLLSDAEASASIDGFVNVLDQAISDPTRTLGQIST